MSMGKLLYLLARSFSPATQITHIPQTVNQTHRHFVYPSFFFVPVFFFTHSFVVVYLCHTFSLSPSTSYWEFRLSLPGPISGRLSKGQLFISTFPVAAGGSCVSALMTLVILVCISPCSTTTVHLFNL